MRLLQQVPDTARLMRLITVIMNVVILTKGYFNNNYYIALMGTIPLMVVAFLYRRKNRKEYPG